ncbi:hypothetical protein ACH5RR_022395 [Cinchona calisaya]|uniref:Uncharacterized protein n=1 Tax=Cinchona calisaya TaxID=153742 RepID=A0ABD2ZCM7_9GENT
MEVYIRSPTFAFSIFLVITMALTSNTASIVAHARRLQDTTVPDLPNEVPSVPDDGPEISFIPVDLPLPQITIPLPQISGLPIPTFPTTFPTFPAVFNPLN